MKTADEVRDIAENANDLRPAIAMETLEEGIMAQAAEGRREIGGFDFEHKFRLSDLSVSELRGIGYEVELYGKSGKRGWKVTW